MRISDWSSDVCSSDLFAVRHDLCGVEGPSKGGLCGVVAQVSELIDRRVLLAGIAGVGALAATSARAQLPNWIQQPAAPLPPPVDYLAVARKQLAMQARNIPPTDRVGVVDFGLPSSDRKSTRLNSSH